MKNAAKLVGWVGGGGVRNSVSGSLAVRVFQANAGTLPKVVGSLSRNGWSMAYPRCGRSFRPAALCLAEIEPFTGSSNTVIVCVK